MPVVRPGVIRETIIVDGEINNVFDFISRLFKLSSLGSWGC